MRILALCLLAGACASARSLEPTLHGARLMAGAEIAAPEGVRGYCERTPDACGGGFSDLRGRMPATGAAQFQPASAIVRERSMSSVFQAMMMTRMAQNGVASATQREETQMNAARWQELARVNRDVNWLIRPATDRALYGVEDYWARPLSDGSRRAYGDCEDYALEKRARLMALGWPASSLAMAVAVAPGVGLHAVLIAQTSEGDFVLDNLESAPAPIDRLNYVWISRQSGPDLGHWSAAYQSGGGAHAFALANETPEHMFERLVQERVVARRQQAGAAATTLPAPVLEVVSASEPASAPDLGAAPSEAPAPASPAPRPAPAQDHDPAQAAVSAGGVWRANVRQLMICFPP